MRTGIGMRREDKHEWEARAPLTPTAVRQLVSQGINVVVQPSPIRAFSDDSYAAAGATVQEDLSGVAVTLAVKEIPMPLLQRGGRYVFFSHTIKGQPHNMPLLAKMMELGCTLIDYEKIVDDKGRRLVFFGRHAGNAGMIDTLHVLGQRLAHLGHETVFADVKLAHHYADLAAAEQALGQIGERLKTEPLPEAIAPLIIGFAGYGNVSQGAQRIAKLLPIEFVSPAELAAAAERKVRDRVLAVVFKEEDLVARKQGAFVLQEYYDHPEHYQSIFARHAVHLSVLINAIYWDEPYPRLIESAFLRDTPTRLLAIGDISCDIDGAIACTVKATTPGTPAYVYNPATNAITDGVQGEGVVMMTTDCLPCELPIESSEAFTGALLPFVPPLTTLMDGHSFEQAPLPDEIRRATILWRGELTDDFAYLRTHLDAHVSHEPQS